MARKDKQKVNRTIVLNLPESMYPHFMRDGAFARQHIDQAYRRHPELFPLDMAHGYKLNGTTRTSTKLGLKMRKIKMGQHSYQIRPSFVLPYMRGWTDELSKPLFLLRFGVPFWALAFVFGKDAMYWYRAYVNLSGFSLVGTSVYAPDRLPEDVLADEHHIRIQGRKAYVTTTIGAHCILGAQTVWHVDADTLEGGYAVFKAEAQHLQGAYTPKTVNTDGWYATQHAWRALFPQVVVIECFLHAFLKVRDRATTSLHDIYMQAADKVWHIYRAPSKRTMAQRIRRLAAWTQDHVPESPMKENLLKLCDKKRRWLAHVDFPGAYRTSSMLDRLMKFMERHARAAQMFHSTIEQTTNNVRAFALLYNFTPSSPTVIAHTPDLVSPAARLNGFVYHQNWLHNLLIAASLGGYKQHFNPL